MTDREADTLPPPDSFREPRAAGDTEPPMSPGFEAILRRVVAEESRKSAAEECAKAFAPVAEHWGNTYVALLDHVERVEELVKNALDIG